MDISDYDATQAPYDAKVRSEQPPGLVGDEAVNIQLAKALAALEIGEFYKESVSFDRGAEAFEQATRCAGGTAGGKQVVDDEHTMTVTDGILVDFQ